MNNLAYRTDSSIVSDMAYRARVCLRNSRDWREAGNLATARYWAERAAAFREIAFDAAEVPATVSK